MVIGKFFDKILFGVEVDGGGRLECTKGRGEARTASGICRGTK